jgi:hypothetical protein
MEKLSLTLFHAYVLYRFSLSFFAHISLVNLQIIEIVYKGK